MSKYLLDTNVLIYLSKPSSPFHAPVIRRLSQFDGTVMVAVSALSFYELEYGVATREAQGQKEGQGREMIQYFRKIFQIVPLSARSAATFGSLKAAYRVKVKSETVDQVGTSVKKHDVDLLIAATALDLGAVLVSGDAIFGKLQRLDPRLKVANWMEEPKR